LKLSAAKKFNESLYFQAQKSAGKFQQEQAKNISNIHRQRGHQRKLDAAPVLYIFPACNIAVGTTCV